MLLYCLWINLLTLSSRMLLLLMDSLNGIYESLDWLMLSLDVMLLLCHCLLLLLKKLLMLLLLNNLLKGIIFNCKTSSWNKISFLLLGLHWLARIQRLKVVNQAFLLILRMSTTYLVWINQIMGMGGLLYLSRLCGLIIKCSPWRPSIGVITCLLYNLFWLFVTNFQ